jgi:hypothetical protein
VAGQRPAAVVDPQFVDPSVRFAVGHDRERKIDSAGFTVEVKNHLLKAASLEDDVLKVLDRGVALREPLPRVGKERLERLRALDASAYRVVHLGLARERLEQRIGLPRKQAVEVGHGDKLLAPPLIEQSLQNRRTEQLGHPRHATSVPYPRGDPSP